jgi:sensor c-di-GMP phosphodiesterase-like protein
MRGMKLAAGLAVFVLAVGALSFAKLNQFGVADQHKVVFSDSITVGDVVLPRGEYVVQHTMEGENHVMVFTQTGVKQPATARVQCHIVSLEAKAPSNQVIYTHNNAEKHVLQELVFAGEKAKHVF